MGHTTNPTWGDPLFVRARTFLPDCSMPALFAWLPAFDADGETSGGSGETPPAEPATGDTEVKVGPNGYPEKTPWREMQPEHQVAYWRHQSTKHETDKKTALQQVNELKPRAEQFAALEQASKTEAERAVEQARREARDATRAEVEAESRVKYGSALIGAEFRVHLAGKLAPEQISTLVDGLDVSRFMTEDGQPDTERIAGYVAAIPATTTTAPPAPGPRVSAGQGNRAPVKASGLDEGASLFAERHKPRAASTT